MIPPHHRVLALLCAGFFAGPLLAVELASVSIDGLDEALEANARRQLSLLRTQATPGGNQFSESRLDYLLRLAPRELREGLEPFGYYDAEVKTDLQREGDSVRLRFTVTPGEPVRVRKLDVTMNGEAGSDPAVAANIEAFLPAKGQAFHHGLYEDSKAGITRTLLQRGFFDVEPGRHRVEVTRAEHVADIALDWNSGRRYRFGPARFEGQQLEVSLLEILVPWQDGQVYDQDQLLALQKTLADLDYFAGVDIQPLPGEASDGRVPIQVSLVPAKRNIYSLGLRLGSDSGAGVSASLERRWLNARGHKLLAVANLAQRKSDITAQYRIPAFSGSEGWYALRTTVTKEQFDDITTQTFEVALSRTGHWHGWDVVAGLDAKRERYDSLLGTGERDFSTLVYPSLRGEWKQADDDNTPLHARGVVFEARAGLQALGSDINFLQLRAEGRYIRAVGERNRLLLRGELGSTFSNRFDQFPPSLRFYAGGDHSIRGFGYKEIGQRLGDVVVGGRHLAVASAEFERMFTPTWGAAVFVDAGDAWDEDFKAEIGVGIGLRWRSPVGPVRVDLGHGLDNADQTIRLHVSLGPDL